MARANGFFRDLAPYLMMTMTDRQDVKEHAQALYGDTYLFYHFFVITHGEAQQIMNARGRFSGAVREE